MSRFLSCLQHSRPCCIGYTNSRLRLEFVYPIQHGRSCCKHYKAFWEKKAKELLKEGNKHRKDAHVNEGKFVRFKYCLIDVFGLLYNCFKSWSLRIMKLWRQHIISVYRYWLSFFYYIKFLNKKESKVICMREFKIMLFQTQSLSIKFKFT
jgi:hypothetical protein